MPKPKGTGFEPKIMRPDHQDPKKMDQDEHDEQEKPARTSTNAPLGMLPESILETRAAENSKIAVDTSGKDPAGRRWSPTERSSDGVRLSGSAAPGD